MVNPQSVDDDQTGTTENPLSRISIIVPTLNEATRITRLLQGLQALRQRGHEVIIADGGSLDETCALTDGLVDALVRSARGRSSQMNAGAKLASGDVLLFLHADTQLPERADAMILKGLSKTKLAWGRFDAAIEGGHVLLPVIAWFMNRRSCLTGICTGDQALFVRHGVFLAMGGYAEIPLMEDIELSNRLKSQGRPLRLNCGVITSGRRWEKRGVIRTIVLMWALRLAYFFGADPAKLAIIYGYEPTTDE